jgi:bifunctional non-homologous end joining protein LigD
VSPSAEPPAGQGWLHEVKHDGHRLLAIVSGDDLKLISRNGHDRTHLFRAPFDKPAAAGLPPLVLDGEIAVPDEHGGFVYFSNFKSCLWRHRDYGR